MTFTSLEPGAYYIILSDEGEKRFDITVYDEAALQEITLRTTNYRQYLFIGGAALFGLAALTIIVVILVRRRKRKKREQAE